MVTMEEKGVKKVGLKIIYSPKGRAKEYGELALNIYNSCNFGCTYCYVPAILHTDRETFHKDIKARDNLLEKVEKDCKSGLIDRPVHLCFTCDPYQDIDLELQLTREVLKLFKQYNINFQMLTKGAMRAARDFDLYKSGDSFGTTLTMLPLNQFTKFWEPNAPSNADRFESLLVAHEEGIKTWVSLEPVIFPEDTLEIIRITQSYVDLYKVGTINYNEKKKYIDWKDFGHKAIELLESYGKEYYIKDDLKAYL
jgi:DNA repair photolyase